MTTLLDGSPCRGMTLAQRTLRSLDAVDAMDSQLRACVHDFGHAIVTACLHAGVSKPESIRQLVIEIWRGARQPQQNSHYMQPGPLATVEWLLQQQSSRCPSAGTLQAVLRASQWTMSPIEPSLSMVAASMDTVTNRDVRVSKKEKHQRRLRAALRQAADELRGNLK